MKGLSKFLKNKNTVTIIGVVACMLILIVGYNMRINQKTALVTVYYAKETIQPKTLITEEMVARGQVPQAFIKGKYFKKYEDIIGKYSNYNTMIAQGSLFYYDLLVEEANLPDAMLYEINEGERLVSFPTSIASTYGNSIMPGATVDAYVKLIDKGNDLNNTADDRIVYGEFLEKLDVLAVKDGGGRNVFENTEENRTPAFLYFSLPEAKYLLYSGMKYIAEHDSSADIEIVIVPNTVKYEVEDPLATEVTSDYYYRYVLARIKQIDNQKELYDALLNEMEQLALEKKKKASDATE